MNKLTITNIPKAKFGDFYGIFFEDINHSADGGLYAEMVRNRSFEFSPIDNPSYNGLTAWSAYEPDGTCVSLFVTDRESADKENPHSLVMAVETDSVPAGVKNEGYNSGFPLHRDGEYTLNIRAKGDTKIKVSLISADSSVVYDSAEFELTENWGEYEAVLKSGEEDFSARLYISMSKTGKAMFDFVSLFPKDTYKGRENGLRKDLAEMLAALNPKFVRFPGGCLVHDGSLNKNDRNSAYRWKNTLGDVKRRPARRSNWNYNQSLGLGYYEYFVFCEDIGAEPLPVLPAGYNPHTRQAVPFDELGEWIDDALDLIEFANGDTNSDWGGVRAKLGHEKPFNLKYIAVGNEEVGDGFFDRYDYFHKAIKERYPEIKIINSAGPFCAGSEYDKGWRSAEKNGSDIIDEHYYMAPEWLITHHDRYADFCGNGTKVFLGEYASCNNYYFNAVAEAAFMTGLENSAHAVELVCYAPLLANAQYVNWAPDMIWFDNHRVYGSASYYVQKMFMNNLPDSLLEIKREGFSGKTPIDDEKLVGKISICADRTSGKFWDIRVTDCETGDVTEYDALSFDMGGSSDICDMNSGRYRVECKMMRTCGDYGFRINYAQTDEDNKSEWQIGGWQNQDSMILRTYAGKGSCLTQTDFSLVTGVEYSLCLEIDGRTIKTYINGKTVNEVEDKRTVFDELYCTAGATDDGEIIVKAVNVNETPTEGVVKFPFEGKVRVAVTELSGYAKDDTNSFKEPRHIFPKEREIVSDAATITYKFEPLSVTVFRVKVN